MKEFEVNTSQHILAAWLKNKVQDKQSSKCPAYTIKYLPPIQILSDWYSDKSET